MQHFDAIGEVVEIIGHRMAPGVETDIALREHDIPYLWPQSVYKQLDNASYSTQSVRRRKGRKDIRKKKLVTIDGSDARDFDDAVYCERNKKGWRLIVAIADVSHYVGVDTALDQEAFNRGNSAYFPNRVVPMLPESLSNGICSINPEENRFCMVCDMQFNGSGEMQGYEFYPGIMFSHARLTYDLVNRIVNERDINERKDWNHITSQLDDLFELFKCLDSKRRDRGTVDFEFPEAFIEYDDKQKISRISARQRNYAHRMIEEFMLSANVCAAKFLNQHNNHESIYRNHKGPEEETLVDLRSFLGGLGLQLGGGDDPEASDYAAIVRQVEERPDVSPVVQTALLRSLGQAVYSTEQLGHFALAYPLYTHFTSPIRRYSDLVVHRQIRHILESKGESQDGSSGVAKQKPVTPEGVSISDAADHCSFTERRAENASRDVVSWLKAEYMLDKVGQEFDGRISSVKEFGLFVLLDEVFVDGLVHVSELGDDYYQYDRQNFQLIGERTAKRFGLGMLVRVRVANVNLSESKIDFHLISAKEGENSPKGGSNTTIDKTIDRIADKAIYKDSANDRSRIDSGKKPKIAKELKEKKKTGTSPKLTTKSKPKSSSTSKSKPKSNNNSKGKTKSKITTRANTDTKKKSGAGGNKSNKTSTRSKAGSKRKNK